VIFLKREEMHVKIEGKKIYYHGIDEEKNRRKREIPILDRIR